MRTRPEPVPYAGGTCITSIRRATKARRLEPSFDGIMCAYYYICGGGDTTTTARPRVKPGDTILVHAGTMRYHPEFYGPDRTNNVTSPYEGTYYLSASGTPERPIAIKAAGDGDVILDGRGNFALFNVKAANYTYFEGLTFRNTDIAIWAGRQFIAGAKGLTVKRCRFEDVGMGVFRNFSGSSDFYIADSSFIGRDDPERSDRLERRLLAAGGRRRRPGVSADDGVVRGGEGLRPRPCRRAQLHRQFPRRHRRRDVRQS